MPNRRSGLGDVMAPHRKHGEDRCQSDSCLQGIRWMQVPMGNVGGHPATRARSALAAAARSSHRWRSALPCPAGRSGTWSRRTGPWNGVRTGRGRNHPGPSGHTLDRKSTRLNSSHSSISYAVFCLKKKKKKLYNFYFKKKKKILKIKNNI